MDKERSSLHTKRMRQLISHHLYRTNLVNKEFVIYLHKSIKRPFLLWDALEILRGQDSHIYFTEVPRIWFILPTRRGSQIIKNSTSPSRKPQLIWDCFVINTRHRHVRTWMFTSLTPHSTFVCTMWSSYFVHDVKVTSYYRQNACDVCLSSQVWIWHH